MADGTLHPRTLLSLKWTQPCSIEEEAVLALITLLAIHEMHSSWLTASKVWYTYTQKKKKNLARTINSKPKCQDWLYVFEVLFVLLARSCFKGSNIMHVFVIIHRIYIIHWIQVRVRHAKFFKMRYFRVTFQSAIKKFCQIFTVYLNRRKLLLYQQ